MSADILVLTPQSRLIAVRLQCLSVVGSCTVTLTLRLPQSLGIRAHRGAPTVLKVVIGRSMLWGKRKWISRLNNDDVVQRQRPPRSREITPCDDAERF